jgi:hypothetical protein
MMTSTEIAELFCKVICGEALPEDLEPFVSEEAIWTVLPVEKMEAASVEDTKHIRFFGPPHLGQPDDCRHRFLGPTLLSQF